MYSVFVAAAAWAGNVLLDKLVLTKRKMRIRDYIPLLFVFLFFLTFLTLPWLGGVNSVLVFNRTYVFFLVLMVLLAILWNIFYYQGLKKEKLLEFEMILLLEPLSTILLASLFFPEEYSAPVFGAAIVASLALIASHLRKHHLDFDKYAIHLLLAVILMSMEVMVQKELLAVFTPATLYAIRTAFLALFFAFYYRPNLHEVDNTNFKIVFATAALGALYMVTRLYGIQEIGITMTTLLLLLGPIIASWADAYLNHTLVKRRTVVAFIVILACVIYVVLMRGV